MEIVNVYDKIERERERKVWGWGKRKWLNGCE